MRIGIISDTHDHLPNIEKAVAVFNREKVQLVIHCGDWCSPFSIDFFKGLNCPMKGVFGNNDADIYMILKKQTNIEFSKRILELNVGNKKAVVFHGDDQQITDSLISSKRYDLVLTGHTHETVEEEIDGVFHINPGTVSQFKKGKINSLFTVAIYDSEKNSCKIIKL